MPVYPDVQAPEKSPEDMADFAPGAKWIELTPDVDVDEPINEGFTGARALTVPEADAAIPPKPKQSFSRKFDRPVFTGERKGGPTTGTTCRKHPFQSSMLKLSSQCLRTRRKTKTGSRTCQWSILHNKQTGERRWHLPVKPGIKSGVASSL